MRTRIIAIANHKGGVGKTTSAANIGAALAARGYSVLLVDLDAQANLTYSLLGSRANNVTSIYSALTGKAALPIDGVGENLHLVPASIELALIESELSARIGRELILSRLLQRDAAQYHYCIIDCPPSLGIITTNALIAATDIYIPLTAEALPLKGLQMIEALLAQISEIGRKVEISGIFFTRYNRRKLNQAVVNEVAARYGERVFSTKIRECIAAAEAPLLAQTIFTYAPQSNAAADYTALAEEIVNRTQETQINKIVEM